MLVRGSRLLLLAILALLLTPAPSQAQRQPPTTKFAIYPSPQGVTAVWSKLGVQVSWQAVTGAAQYLVMRGPEAATVAQIAVLAPAQLTHIDQGFNANAVYQIIAVSTTGGRGASAVVAYTPPAAMVMTKPIAISTTTLGTRTTTMAGTAPSGAAPVITSLEQPPAGSTSARIGETVVVRGTGLDGLNSVVLVWAEYLQGGFYAGGAGTYPTGWYARGPSYPVTPINASQSGFSFVAQNIPTPGTLAQNTPYLVIVTKGTAADTSNVPLALSGAMPVRKITGVTEQIIRSGARVNIQGVGLNEVIGGHFGTGLPGSVTNPLLNAWNRTATSVQLETTPSCDQEGFLELKQSAIAGESSTITSNPLIKIACVPNTPSGFIVGTESSANGMVYALPNSKISIRGTGLKYVTKVISSGMTSYPFTYAKVGTNIELLSVTLPGAPNGPYALQFFLENPLTNPVSNGTVTGIVSVMSPPVVTRVEPGWAEPGQLVYVYGSSIKNSVAPEVRVGGVTAQVVTSAGNSVSFRLGAGTTAGPIEIQNEAGKTTFTGTFTTPMQTTHPGFFVVSGPSVITSVTAPNATLAYGDILTVTGQNLARLGGICVVSSGQGGVNPGYLYLRRPGGVSQGSAQMGSIASNTTMQVTLEWQPVSVAPGPVQLYQSSQPVGDMPPTQFACQPQATVVNWP